MLTPPSLVGLSWAKIRTLARSFATSEATSDVVTLACAELASDDPRHRLHATYLLGFTAEDRPANLTVLRERVVPDPSW
ncbi:MAG: hypothetical protein ACRDIY_02165, partial [Chloroflexota bacterium]